MGAKVIIYQILPRLWGNLSGKNVKGGSLAENGCGHFSDVDSATLEHIKSLGVTHLWLTGIIRHACTEAFEACPASDPLVVKGRAGSPYAIVDYYDVNPYLADNQRERMMEFEELVDRIHSSGLKVLIDFVPNHVARDYGKAGLARTDVAALGAEDDSSVHWKAENDFYYYPGQSLVLPSGFSGGNEYHESPAKASGNCFSPAPSVNDWYETIRLNYCDFHTKTWDKMLDIVLYWRSKGVDGFRCDMVEMVPPQFFKWLISNVKSSAPDTLFVAEVYDKLKYPMYVKEVGFDLLYDKSGQYDEVRALVEGHGSAENLTVNWQSLGALQPHMLNFLENHDEQRFASDFFGGDEAESEAALAYSLLFNGAAYMIYCGEEVGERGMDEEGFSGKDGRTTIFDWWSVRSLKRLNEYIHGGSALTAREKEVLERYSRIFRLASGEKAFSEGANFDICYCNRTSPGFDPHWHSAFLRGCQEAAFLCVCNFSSRDASMTLDIPPAAWGHFSIKENPDRPKQVEVIVKKHSCAIVKL